MTIRKHILTFLMLSSLISCTVSTDNFPKPEKLRIEIANSITIPFQNGDTVIYQSFVGICGNSSKDELNRFFEPHLNEQPYFGILKQKVNKKMYCTGDSLSMLMNRLCKYNSDSLTDWDCFSKNKIVMSITDEAVTNHSVKILEKYSFNNEEIIVNKLFSYTNNNWTYITID